MRGYRIWHCAQVWKAMGIDVAMQPWNRKPIDAGLVVPQIDLSVLPRKNGLSRFSDASNTAP